MVAIHPAYSAGMSTAAAATGNLASDPFNPAEASLDDLRRALSTPSDVDFAHGEQVPPQPELSKPELAEPEALETEPAETEETDDVQAEASQESGQESGQEDDGQEDPEDVLKKMRIRPRDKRDQQVMDLYKSEGFEGTFEEAVRIIYGQQQTQQKTEPEAEQRVEAPAPDTVSAALETVQKEIVDAEAQLKAAIEDFDQVKVAELQRKLARLDIQAARLEDRQEREREVQAQTIEQTRRQQAAESRERAGTKYPVLNSVETVERKQFDAFLQEAAQNPALAPIFESPLWPEIMADRFAERVRLAPAQQTPATPPATPQQKRKPVTGTQAKQLTTGQTAQPEQTVTRETLRQNLNSISSDDLRALLGKSA